MDACPYEFCLSLSREGMTAFFTICMVPIFRHMWSYHSLAMDATRPSGGPGIGLAPRAAVRARSGACVRARASSSPSSFLSSWHVIDCSSSYQKIRSPLSPGGLNLWQKVW